MVTLLYGFKCLSDLKQLLPRNIELGSLPLALRTNLSELPLVIDLLNAHNSFMFQPQ